jgi:hypothetical protein
MSSSDRGLFAIAHQFDPISSILSSMSFFETSIFITIGGFAILFVAAGTMPGYNHFWLDRKIGDRVVRSVVKEMIIGENYERNIIPIRSDISRFSRGTGKPFSVTCSKSKSAVITM